MSAMNRCNFCERYKRWNDYSCNECNGTNDRKSYLERSLNLARCIADAAIEEARFKATVGRMRQW